MQPTSVCPTPAMVERYYRLASQYAADFFQAMLMQPVMLQRWQDYFMRNRTVLRPDSTRRNLEIALILFYLSAGLVEGVLLVQMLDAGLIGDSADGRFWYNWLALLAGIGPLGCSLWAGYCFCQIQIRADAQIDGRLHITWDWLAAFLFVSSIYLAFIYFLSTCFKSQEGLSMLRSIPLLAVLELVLGIPASAGISALIIMGTERFHFNRVRSHSKELIRLAGQTATHFRHFQIYRNLYNRHYPDLAIEFRSSPQIERAIEYYEGRFTDNFLGPPAEP